jgi:hypothetical protein
MNLGVRLRDRPRRGDLNAEVFDGPYQHDMGAGWQAGRLKWGFELSGGGGGGGDRSVDRDYWLWPEDTATLD